MVKTQNSMQCFVKKDGKYMILQRNPNKEIMPGVWMAPGGRREFCEPLFEATRREIIEETGLNIKNLKIKVVGVAHMQDIDLELHFHMLTAEHDSGQLIKNQEDGKFVWLTPKQIKQEKNLLSELKHVIEHILSDSTEILSYKAVYEKGNKLKSFKLENP
ncbi:MAG: Nucleoside triphosphatase NudI [Candidatus Woesearchaeota archaeon]|nr:Nucleoside triphosphatase NudI [Candidatus Woesearchaeota archaeon]